MYIYIKIILLYIYIIFILKWFNKIFNILIINQINYFNIKIYSFIIIHISINKRLPDKIHQLNYTSR